MNCSVLVKLEGVMVNEFNVEEIYEKGLRRRVGFNKEVEDEVSEKMYLLKEEKMEEFLENKMFIDRKVEKIKSIIKNLREELKEEKRRIKDDKNLGKVEKKSREEMYKNRIDNRINKLKNRIEDLNNDFKNLKISIREMLNNAEESVRKEISKEKSKELEPIRKREKEIVMKEIKKEYDENFEKLNLRRGVKEVFDRLFKLKMKYEGLRIIVKSEVRSLKVRRLLNNVGLDFCEVINSSVEGWNKEFEELKKKSELLIEVEKVEDLEFLVENVKNEIKLKNRLRV